MLSRGSNSRRPSRRPVVYGVTTHSTAYAFLSGQLLAVAESGRDVHLVVGSNDERLEDFAQSQLVTVHCIPTGRAPGLGDLVWFVRLLLLFWRLRPAMTIMGTPKMGVLGTVAAFCAFVPKRIYLVHGLRWEGLNGLRKRAIKWLDWLACMAATKVVAVSPSVVQKLESDRVCRRGKAQVLGAGSANGVDTLRFSPVTKRGRDEVRAELRVPFDAKLVVFVGRLTHDKGISDLDVVWRGIARDVPEAWLLIVGDADSNDPRDLECVEKLRTSPRTLHAPFMKPVERVFQAADVNIMLSHREGLGMVNLEAASCEVPTVATQSPG